VRFVITPTDETFRKVNKLISKDMREAMRLLGTDNGILDLRTPNIDLESDDFSALDRERPGKITIGFRGRSIARSGGHAGV
jgi:hypothetical protein